VAPTLNRKRAAFVREYLKDLNATAAAIRAGYSAKTADHCGPRLLRFAPVRSAVDAAIAARAEKLGLSAERVLTAIERIATKAEDADEYASALKGHELLGKHLKLFTEKHEVGGPGGEALAITINLTGRR